jgi:hypothetical protein
MLYNYNNLFHILSSQNFYSSGVFFFKFFLRIDLFSSFAGCVGGLALLGSGSANKKQRAEWVASDYNARPKPITTKSNRRQILA